MIGATVAQWPRNLSQEIGKTILCRCASFNRLKIVPLIDAMAECDEAKPIRRKPPLEQPLACPIM